MKKLTKQVWALPELKFIPGPDAETNVAALMCLTAYKETSQRLLNAATKLAIKQFDAVGGSVEGVILRDNIHLSCLLHEREALITQAVSLTRSKMFVIKDQGE